MSRVTKQPVSGKTTTTTQSKGGQPLSWKERLHPQEYEQLRATFDIFDEDKSGVIDPQEINKIMEELG